MRFNLKGEKKENDLKKLLLSLYQGRSLVWHLRYARADKTNMEKSCIHMEIK